MVEPLTTKTYTFKSPEGKEISIVYVEDDFEGVEGISNNGVRLRSEKELADKIDREIENNLKMMIWLQEFRKDISRIAADHQNNRSDTERKMVG